MENQPVQSNRRGSIERSARSVYDSERQGSMGRRERRRSRLHRRISIEPIEWGKLCGFAIFALLVCGAPLAFGTVDRPWQIAFTLLFALGLAVAPIQLARCRWTAGLIALCAVGIWLAAKEFIPVAWLGVVPWRAMMQQTYGIVFPFTHHPEPGRAVDVWMAIGAGLLWLLWVRSLASDPAYRSALVWCLTGAATLVALVSMFLHGDPAAGIFGVRQTPGWTGFGPFPNRNHTACFLAMGTMAACGLMVRSFRKRVPWQSGVSISCIILMVVALLHSRSRGGMVACAVGAALFGAMILFRRRDRATVVLLVGAVLLGASLFLAFGGPMMERFGSEEQGTVSNLTRMALWKDTLQMLYADPLLGHGLGSFASVFPAFMTMKAYGVVILHPESSFLLWVVEAGLLASIASFLMAGTFVVRRLPGLIRETHSFDLRLGALAAVLVLATHSLWDVPAHRWATAFFGLAALGIAFPSEPDSNRHRIARPGLSFFAVAIAFLWLMPYLTLRPAWAPASLERLVAKATTSPSRVTTPQLERSLRYFPLSASLHQLLGVRYLSQPGWEQKAVQHFRAADRIKPAIWTLPMLQARLVAPFSARLARHFWTLAIERGGHRAEEFFYLAWDATVSPADGSGAAFWQGYAEANPYLLLSYAQRAPEDKARSAFLLWWETRSRASDLQQFEVGGFYRLLPKYGTADHAVSWMHDHPERRENDWMAWARIMTQLGDAEGGWTLLERFIREPEFPRLPSGASVGEIEATWARDPGDFLAAQGLAQAWSQMGRNEASEKLILEVGARKDAPLWFKRKAGFILARSGKYDEAVETLLSAK